MPLSRTFYMMPLLTLLVVLTAGIYLSEDAEAATITVDTDWVVDSNEDIATDNTYVMRANLTLTASGQISFRRCKFQFMSEQPGDYGILVQPGGYLTLHTCTLRSGYLSPGVLAEAWTFHVQDSGRLSLQASMVQDVGVIGGAERERGLAIESDNVMVSGTEFQSCNRGLVVLGGASPELRDNTFERNLAGIEAMGSQFRLTSENTFIENNVGLLFHEVDSGYVSAGDFRDNAYSIEAVMSTVRVYNITVVGAGDAFVSEVGSYIVADNCTLMVLGNRTKAILNSRVQLINCDAPGLPGFTQTDANSHITVKVSVHFRVAYAGADYPVEGADVELLDNLGSKVYQQVTDSDGLSPARHITIFEHHGDQPSISHQTYDAVASAGFNYEEKKDITLGPNHVIEMTFVDDVAPDLTVQLPVDGSSQNDPEVVMRGRVKDLNSGISAFHYTVNGGENISLPIQDPWEVLTILPEGDLVIEFHALDLLGNEAVVTRRLTIDVTPPDVTNIDPPLGTVTRAFQLRVNGTTDVGATLKVQGLDWEVGPDGNFTGWVTLADNEGEQTIAFKLTDAAGNTGVYGYTVSVDRTPPALVVETDPDHRDFPFLNRSRVLLFGTSEPGVVVKVHINSTLANQTVVDELGKWSMVVQLVLGENDLLVDAWDVAGNRASVEIIDFIYDVTAPEITLLIPDDGEVFKNKHTTVLVKVRTEPDALVWVNDELEQIQPAHCEVEFPEVDLKFEGNNTITIYAQDKAGNLATVTIVVVREEKKEPDGNDTEGFPVWLVVLALAIVVVAAVVVQRYLGRGG